VQVASSGSKFSWTSGATYEGDFTRFLRVLLDSEQRADVTLVVERSCLFDAHRLVLAMRSPVFRAKFSWDSRDSSLEWFRVHDVSAPVFRAMLHFIYTDELPPADEVHGAARLVRVRERGRAVPHVKTARRPGGRDLHSGASVGTVAEQSRRRRGSVVCVGSVCS